MEYIHSVDEMRALLANHEMLLVYFGGHACGVCRAMQPKLAHLLTSYPMIHAARVEVSEASELCAQYSVFTIPVVLFFIGGREFLREAQIISLDQLNERLARYTMLADRAHQDGL